MVVSLDSEEMPTDLPGTIITTYPKGLEFDFDNITADMIDIEDIAWALSHNCRYHGFVPRHYSVAEHSIRAAMAASPCDRFDVLMHDAAEAYITDLARPYKRRLWWSDGGGMRQVRQLEEQVQSVIRSKYGAPNMDNPAVHEADLRMYVTERVNLFGWDARRLVEKYGVGPYPDILHVHDPLTPDVTNKMFLMMFEECRRHN
jgi:hypothetical protein